MCIAPYLVSLFKMKGILNESKWHCTIELVGSVFSLIGQTSFSAQGYVPAEQNILLWRASNHMRLVTVVKCVSGWLYDGVILHFSKWYAHAQYTCRWYLTYSHYITTKLYLIAVNPLPACVWATFRIWSHFI